MATIHEIMADPRYEEFAADCTAAGRQVVPWAFPWRHMGMTDAAFLALPLTFEDGTAMSENMKVRQLAVVRAQERLVVEYWAWWLGWSAAARQLGHGEPADQASPGMLF